MSVVVLGVLLTLHERRTTHPLMHPFVWQDRQVLGANVATVGASAGMLSLLYFFNLFAQSAATFDHAALSVLAALAPFVASMLVCALFAHWFGHRVGPRGPVACGLALMVVGFGMLGTVTDATTEAQLYLPLAVAGVGAGITNASLTSVAVLHLPAGRMNEAAGWVSLSRFLGSAMALAVGTATFLSVAASRRPGEVVVPDRNVDTFDAAAASLERDLSGPLAAATAGAETAERFARTMGVTSAVLAAVLVVSWWLLSSPATSAQTRVPRSTRP